MSKIRKNILFTSTYTYCLFIKYDTGLGLRGLARSKFSQILRNRMRANSLATLR